jgi:cation:H+ antiporter
LSALDGTATLGLGVILGANVADLTLVIGIVVLLAGCQKMTSSMLRSLKISFVAVLLPIFLLLDGEISQFDGIILVSAFAFRSAESNACDVGIGNILGNVLADSMLTIGVIALISPIKVPKLASPLTAGVFLAASIVFVYLRSKGGKISKGDAKLLIGVYALFVLFQYTCLKCLAFKSG